MQNIVKSMLDEVGAMMSGHVIPYHKVAIVVAAVIALLFSLVFSHSTVFEGKIAVIDLDASNDKLSNSDGNLCREFYRFHVASSVKNEGRGFNLSFCYLWLKYYGAQKHDSA
ncbi:hypothetical protein BB936_11510 [Yersinia enterocolitica]|nr:hypothetical protein BB936_11510 [Yersinia enterocolitica]